MGEKWVLLTGVLESCVLKKQQIDEKLWVDFETWSKRCFLCRCFLTFWFVVVGCVAFYSPC